MAFEPARNADRQPQAPPQHQADSAPTEGCPLPLAQNAGAPGLAEDAAIAGPPSGEERTPGTTTAARWRTRLAAGAVRLGRRLDAALPPGAARAVAAAARVPPAAAAAGAIAVAALVLALLAGDGDGEFPGPAFEAQMLSRAPRQALEASGSVASMAPDALAERLVEDPAFDLRLDANAAVGATAEAAAVGGPAGLSAAEPPPSSPDDAGAPLLDGGARDPVAVLAAAVPPPADPALRVLEQLRARDSAPPAAAGSEAEAGLAIQLLAAGRRELATEAWSRLQRDNADILGGLQPTIVEPERTVSTLFRLRAGPLATVREAQAVCAALVRRKVDCIVVGGG